MRKLFLLILITFSLNAFSQDLALNKPIDKPIDNLHLNTYRNPTPELKINKVLLSSIGVFVLGNTFITLPLVFTGNTKPSIITASVFTTGSISLYISSLVMKVNNKRTYSKRKY